MFIVEHPVFSMIVALAVLAFFKILFWIGDFLSNLGNSKKSSPAKKEDKKEEKKEDKAPAKTDNVTEKEIPKVNNATKADTSSNYLYDRFVVTPTNDDKNNCYQKINDAFIEVKQADAIKNNKVKIKVEPANLEIEKNKRIQEILSNAESRQKLLDEFSAMPKEMKIMMIENLIKKM